MGKRNALKAKLKAADKRRKNRLTRSPEQASTQIPKQPGVDVVGILVAELLMAFERTDSINDSVAVAALRSIHNESPPKAEPTRALYQSMINASQEHAVPHRGLRDATRELLDLAGRYNEAEEPCCFLKYLSVLAM